MRLSVERCCICSHSGVVIDNYLDDAAIAGIKNTLRVSGNRFRMRVDPNNLASPS